MTHIYQESGPSPDRLEESKKRIPMICNSFGWSGTCLCKDSRTLLVEGLVWVRGGKEGVGSSSIGGCLQFNIFKTWFHHLKLDFEF